MLNEYGVPSRYVARNTRGDAGGSLRFLAKGGRVQLLLPDRGRQAYIL